MAFAKGQSGNPGGRKKSIITIELEKIAKSEFEPGISKAQKLAEVMFGKALEAEPVAYKYVTDRLDGTPTQAVKQVDDNGDAVIPAIQVSFIPPKHED